MTRRSIEDWARECAARPGRQWRLRAHDGTSAFEAECKGTFDELVVDHWLHIEQMDERMRLVRVGDRGLFATVNADGSISVNEADS